MRSKAVSFSSGGFEVGVVFARRRQSFTTASNRAQHARTQAAKLQHWSISSHIACFFFNVDLTVVFRMAGIILQKPVK